MADIEAIIGQGTYIRGNVRGDGNLTVAGRVEGAIEVQGEVVFEDTAIIQSDVTADRIVVRGALAGDLHASDAIVLEAGGRVVGDLEAARIQIEDGALFRGRIEMQRAEAPAAASQPRAAAQRAPSTHTTSRTPAREAPAARTPARARAAEPPPEVEEPKQEAAPPPPPPPAEPPAEPPAATKPRRTRAKPAAAKPAATKASSASKAPPSDKEQTQDQPPPPVVPALKKKSKGSVRKRGSR